MIPGTAEEQKVRIEFPNVENSPSMNLRTESPMASPHSDVQVSAELELARAVEANLFRIIKYYFVAFMSLLVFTVIRCFTTQYNWLSFHLAIHCWTIYYLHELVVELQKYRLQSASITSTMCYAKIPLLSAVCMVLFLLLLSLMQLDVSAINAFSVSVPLFVALVLEFFRCAFCKTGCDALSQIVDILVAFFRLTTVFMALMKVQGRITSNWPTALW